MTLDESKRIVRLWAADRLKYIRFSGGEPTLHPHLIELVAYTKSLGVERIAISTNGSMNLDYYKKLIEAGVNDYSISLDGCCATINKEMTGGVDSYFRVTNNIRRLSQLTYVTVGMVFTESNIDRAVDSVIYADSLGASDIRIVPSAQYNEALRSLAGLPSDILHRHPILKYRIKNVLNGRSVRGIKDYDSGKCFLALDDMAIAGKWHFPCIIYLREGGDPIGEIGENMRRERIEWFAGHDSQKDNICKEMCLDVCIDYNNRVRYFRDIATYETTPATLTGVHAKIKL